MHSKTMTFIALATASLGVFSADWKPLAGSYAITAEHYLDPAPDEPGNSHFRLQLSDDAARELYIAMPSPVTVDRCTGAASKSVGDMQCLFYAADSRYECAFSINLLTNTIEYGVAC